MKTILITGSNGLIGSESVKFFTKKGFNVVGIDNDMRSYFFGKKASTKSVFDELSKLKNYTHHDVDIRDFDKLQNIFKSIGSKIVCVIHTAAQPSHDWAIKEPITDFTINSNGTLNLLELTRIYCKDSSYFF